jgi:hypothetical protein
MSSNFLKLVLLTILSPFLFGSTCNKDSSKPCTMVTPFSFNVTSEFSPQKEIYNVGDTIFLTSTFPKLLINLISTQQVNYSNSLSIGGSITFGLLDTILKTGIDSYSKFKVSSTIGSSSQITNTPNKGIVTNYIETSSEYRISLGIKLLEKGIFVIGISNLNSNGLRGKDCTNAGFNMTVINSNKNLNLFQYALGYPADNMLAKNIYCFRVQELELR